MRIVTKYKRQNAPAPSSTPLISSRRISTMTISIVLTDFKRIATWYSMISLIVITEYLLKIGWKLLVADLSLIRRRHCRHQSYFFELAEKCRLTNMQSTLIRIFNDTLGWTIMLAWVWLLNFKNWTLSCWVIAILVTKMYFSETTVQVKCTTTRHCISTKNWHFQKQIFAEGPLVFWRKIHTGLSSVGLVFEKLSYV